MLDKVKFETNVPIELALKFDSGKPVPGSYGDQVLYSVVHDGQDKVVYVEPIVDRRMQDLGIRRGERFSITKAEVKNGTRRGIEWKVARVDPPAAGWQAPAASPQPAPNGNGHAVPTKVPYDVAFNELLDIVTGSLKDHGEQWSDEAKQGAVSTLFIQACRDGYCTMWSRQ
jgi:hypothetical protein